MGWTQLIARLPRSKTCCSEPTPACISSRTRRHTRSLSESMSDVCSHFFSRRRRHTRCLSDWSSDVCSSDLLRLPVHHHQADQEEAEDGETSDADRSEERRVGKERRFRGSPPPYKK